MINLTERSLPNTVSVGGKDFPINTDFRVWMQFEIKLSKMQPGEYIDVSTLFKDEFPQYCSIPDLLKFSRPHNELPRAIYQSKVIAYDYELDSDLIFAAFWGQYGIDLTTADLHWHKFLALFNGLNDSTKMKEVMQYRCYEKHYSDRNRDIYEDLRSAWEIIRKTPEEQQEIEKFNSYFE